MWEKLLRWRWALLTAFLLAAGLIYALWPEALAVDTGKVSRGEMTVGITDDGVTRAEEVYIVSAPVTGYLERIEFEAGDIVSRGTLITRMTGRPSSPLDQRTKADMTGALAAARAAEVSTAAALSQSERDLVRAEQLLKRDFFPRSQFEALQTQVATNRSALQQARAEVARLRAMLVEPSGQSSGTPIAVRSPASGEVLSVINESENVIAEGTPLVTIGNPDSIEIVVDLLSREAVRVKPGDRVSITQWGGPEALAGRVDRIEPFGTLRVSALGIEEQRVNVIVALDDAAKQGGIRLGHGYQLDATIELWRDDNALRVPIGALFRGADGEWQVYAVNDGRARITTVELGHINDEYAQVIAGLGQDTEVIVNPGSALEDGARVSVRR